MADLVYNLNKQAGRKKIKDRGIKWEESYRERSAPLKEKFEDTIGPGSYYRWEGHDFTSNSIYYIVVGPSVQHNVGKMFFAGIKKVPLEDFNKDPDTKTYSPYGEYFPTIKGALIYASQRWGVKIPPNQVPYTRESIESADIPEHIKA